mgnify:CR=1 FL=1
MNQHEFTLKEERDHLSFFYDSRSRNIGKIQEFLASSHIQKLQESIEERAYIVLGWDGLFVHVAKEAHRDESSILGINFGTKGFLLHDQDIFHQKDLFFSAREYPILHADVHIGEEHVHGHAFNEVYITRAWDASSVHLSFAQKWKVIERYSWDGLMISTPAGSTGWSRSYGWVILPHNANLNVLTPLGNTFPREFHPTVISDKWRVRIKNDTTREAPIDILVDNRRIVSMESRPFELVIERATRWVRLLIEQSYRERWDAKVYEEQGMTLEK